MNWDQFLGPLESVALLFVVGLLVKVFVTNSKKVDRYTREMWDSTKKAEGFLRQIDQEFDSMNKYASSIKGVFLNISKIQKDLSDGKKTVEEAIQEINTNIPENLHKNFAKFILVDDYSTANTLNNDVNFSLSDVDEIKTTIPEKFIETENEAESKKLSHPEGVQQNSAQVISSL